MTLGLKIPAVRRRNIKYASGIAAVVLALFYYFALPDPLFCDPYSSVLEDRHGRLLGAGIAADGQWRFPEQKTVPLKFKEAIVAYEDKRFVLHPGIDVLAMSRAIRQNIRERKIVSGGSTLSMQVIRLSRKGKARTFLEKIIEVILATRLECRYSKSEILNLYCSHAPFGGNVVGLEAACWRYFGRYPDELSWSEAATLAVLPNNPALVHPGRHRDQLRRKRDFVLTRLRAAGKIDAFSYQLAVSEPLPQNPLPLPQHAPHLLGRMALDGFGQARVKSTIDKELQLGVEQILSRHHERLKANQIQNAAALILDVKTGNVLAYVGNVKAGRENQEDVDIIRAPRSTGSILKPFLFAAMLDEGKMLQRALVPDIPTLIDGFAPKNFSRDYDGAVPADKALIRSLNVPAVHELRTYRYEKFYTLLKEAGLTTLHSPADHYGLSLILGGAEGTLWDITGAYASLARTLINYFDEGGANRYRRSDFRPPTYVSRALTDHPSEQRSLLSAAAIWITFETLKELYRPGEETGWKYFNSSKTIAWKTGTSFGFRDGWAVGVNPDYAVGVWVGNADGEGRPGLVGSETAAPILFDIFSSLPGRAWFRQPYAEMQQVKVCSKSGCRAAATCPEVEDLWVTKPGLETAACAYHRNVHLSPDEKYRVHSACASVDNIKTESWFVLPPVEEFYFRSKNVSYKPLPPFRSDCVNPASIVSLDMVYPKQNSKIFIPRELDGQRGSAIFELTHRSAAATVYWHLDGNFVGSTKNIHKLSIAPEEGKHVLTLVDEFGEQLERRFSVISNP